MRRLPLVVAAILTTALVSVAQQPAPHATPSRMIAAADQPTREQLVMLFEVMRIRSQLEGMLKMLPAALQQQLQNEEQDFELNNPSGGQLTPDQKAAEDKVTKKYFDLTAGLYPTDEMVNDMVLVYQRHLTRQDVNGIIAFYRSEPGQHILEAQPLMAEEVMPAVTKKLEARSKELLEKYTKELNQAVGQPNLPPASPPPVSPAPPKS